MFSHTNHPLDCLMSLTRVHLAARVVLDTVDESALRNVLK